MTTPNAAPPETLIDAARAQIKLLAGWNIWPAQEEDLTADTRVETLIHDGETLIAFLPTLRINEVLKVTIDGKEIPADDYFVESTGIIEVDDNSGRFRRARRLVATVSHGYDKEPAELSAIAQAMAVRAANPHGSMTVGGISLGGTTAPTLQSTEWRTLDAYKLGPLS